MPLSLSQGICCFSDILSNVAILAAHVQMYYCRAISFHGHTLQSFALSKQYRIHCFQLDNSYPKHIKISMLRILQLKTAGVLHTSIKSAISCIPDYLLHLHLFCWSVIVHLCATLRAEESAPPKIDSSNEFRCLLLPNCCDIIICLRIKQVKEFYTDHDILESKRVYPHIYFSPLSELPLVTLSPFFHPY